jgi:hypothetical protein
VLYNGKENYPAEKTLWLSSLFKKKKGKKKIIDAEIRVLNINKGNNPELMRRSKTLSNYANLIAKVREYEEIHPLEEAIRLASKYCIDNNILKEYLKQHVSEVINMLTTEFNLDEAKKVIREEAMEEGIEKGIKKGIKEGKKEVQNYILNLIEQGFSSEQIKKKIKEIS